MHILISEVVNLSSNIMPVMSHMTLQQWLIKTRINCWKIYLNCYKLLKTHSWRHYSQIKLMNQVREDLQVLVIKSKRVQTCSWRHYRKQLPPILELSSPTKIDLHRSMILRQCCIKSNISVWRRMFVLEEPDLHTDRHLRSLSSGSTSCQRKLLMPANISGRVIRKLPLRSFSEMLILMHPNGNSVSLRCSSRNPRLCLLWKIYVRIIGQIRLRSFNVHVVNGWEDVKRRQRRFKDCGGWEPRVSLKLPCTQNWEILVIKLSTVRSREEDYPYSDLVPLLVII